MGMLIVFRLSDRVLLVEMVIRLSDSKIAGDIGMTINKRIKLMFLIF